jgi:hypothetical protein
MMFMRVSSGAFDATARRSFTPTSRAGAICFKDFRVSGQVATTTGFQTQRRKDAETQKYDFCFAALRLCAFALKIRVPPL